MNRYISHSTNLILIFIHISQDRIEAAIVWSLKKDHVLWEGCKFLYKAEDDPCLKEWEEERRNAYSASAALYAWSLKSNGSSF